MDFTTENTEDTEAFISVSSVVNANYLKLTHYLVSPRLDFLSPRMYLCSVAKEP